ncbi:glycine amidinotransferase [Spirillospora sp. NPDC047279]|uniref:glycine amidinotransferase n=1 Tax=Spirillospora sp. NPDC047279 TaxID=3155478 RepID=UPI0033D7B606
MTGLVSSYNDFDPLEEIVVGTANGYHLPAVDTSLRHFFQIRDGGPELAERVDAARLARVVEETEEDLAAFSAALIELGVRVRRPEPWAAPTGLGEPVALPGWESTANHALMPRDCLLVVGSTVIEAPMPVRARYAETFPFRELLIEYFAAGARWLAAPRPQLADDTYRYAPDGRPVLAETEPLFDAANVIRCGTDLFFNVSNTGNRLAARWLARALGDGFTVHEIEISDDHVGTTLHLLRPGLLLANAGRLGPGDVPAPLRSWKTLWFDEPADDGHGLDWPRASTWIGMNVVSVDRETVIVPEAQTGLMRLLEKEGLTVVPVPYRHGRTFGGGFHCCSLDVRRRGVLESYVEGRRRR